MVEYVRAMIKKYLSLTIIEVALCLFTVLTRAVSSLPSVAGRSFLTAAAASVKFFWKISLSESSPIHDTLDPRHFLVGDTVVADV